MALGSLRALFPCCIALLPVIVNANVGVFTGDGFTIELQHSADVQLVSERVSIQFHHGALPFTGGVDALDMAAVECDFELANLSDSALSIQTGFPLNSQFVRERNIRDSQETLRDLGLYEDRALKTYQFLINDQERSYRPRYVPQDRSHDYQGIFLWTLSFAPHETKRLHVGYEIPVSETLAPTDEPLDYDKWKTFVAPIYVKPWYHALAGGVLEYFQYVTTTGGSWAGSVNRADFSANVCAFHQYLSDRGILDQKIYDSLKAAYSSRPQNNHSLPVANKVLVKAVVTPSGWVERENNIEKHFENYRPDSNLSFQFWETVLPSTPDGIDTLLVKCFGKQVSPEDVSDLREIYAAFFGIPPRTERVAHFVKYQSWYTPESSKTIDSLLPNERQLLDHLAAREKGFTLNKMK